MNSYMSGAQLKQKAKSQLYGRLGTVIGAFLLHFTALLVIEYFLGSVNTNYVLGIVIYFVASLIIDLFMSIFSAGECYIYLNVCTGNEAAVSDIFYGFKGFAGKTILIRFVPVLVMTLAQIPAYLVMQLFSSVAPSADEMFMMLQTGDIDTLMKTSEELFPITSLYLILLLFQVVITLAMDVIFSQTLFLMLDYPDYSVIDILKYSVKILKGNWGRYLYVKLSFIPWYILGIATCYISYVWSFPYQRATMADFYLELMQNYNKDGNTPDGYNN